METQFIESNILLAVLSGDYGSAEEKLANMTNHEIKEFIKGCEDSANLARAELHLG